MIFLPYSFFILIRNRSVFSFYAVIASCIILLDSSLYISYKYLHLITVYHDMCFLKGFAVGLIFVIIGHNFFQKIIQNRGSVKK